MFTTMKPSSASALACEYCEYPAATPALLFGMKSLGPVMSCGPG